MHGAYSVKLINANNQKVYINTRTSSNNDDGLIQSETCRASNGK